MTVICMNSTKSQVSTDFEVLEQVQRRAVKLVKSPEGKSYEELMKDKESREKDISVYLVLAIFGTHASPNA